MENETSKNISTSSVQVGPSNDFKKFQMNLKRTSLGVRFGRKLFSTDPKSISPADIVQIMRALGLNIPREVQMTVDAAQLIVTGQAAIEAAENVETLDDIRSVTMPAFSSIKLASRLSHELGWVDSQTVDHISFGTNIAMIIASGGANVAAWIGLAMDFAKEEIKNKIIAKQLAVGEAQALYMSIISPQARAAAENLKLYQESSKLPRWTEGRLSTYGFIGKLAESSPDLWPQFFPEFQVWAPVGVRTIRSESDVTSWYGSHAKDSASITWKSLALMSRDKIREWVFFGLIEKHIYPFYLANEQFKNKAELYDLCLLSTMTDLDFVSSNVDYSWLLDQVCLTPSDFADPVLQTYLHQVQDPTANISSAVTIDGKAVLSQTEKQKLLEEQALFKNKDFLIGAELGGRIDLIRRFPKLNQVLKDHYTFGSLTSNPAMSELEKSWFAFKEGRGGEVFEFEGPSKAWRFMRNMIGALGMIEDLKRDPFFKDWGMDDGVFGTGNIERYSFLGDMQAFEKNHAHLSMLSALRSVNTAASYNLAYFFNTTPDKLVRVTGRREVGPAIFKVV